MNGGNEVHQVLAKIFDGIVFYKKEDYENTSQYVTRLENMSTGDRTSYIILICSPNPKPKALYRELNVKSVQTRKLPNYHFQCPGINFRQDKEGFFVNLFVKERTREHSIYSPPDNSVEVLIYNNSKKKDMTGKVSMNQYNDKINLWTALESFACIINLKNDFNDEFVLL